jgi:PKD repeat protein
MKNSLLKLMPLVLVIFLLSCEDDSHKVASDVKNGPKPEAAFTYTVNFLEVQFTNESTNDQSYYWDFGDGTHSTEESPVHVFASGGTYNVTLKVNSAAGYSSQTSSSFTVVGAANAFFSYKAQRFREGGFGRIIDFDATASQNTEGVIFWDFGDGSDPVEGAFTPMHEFPDYGIYTVKLKVKGLLEGDENEIEILVEVIPDYEMIRGGGMETSDAAFWSLKNVGSSNQYPVEFGYEGDGPSGGKGGCLRFVGRTSAGSHARAVYQAIDVIEGERFQLSAQVKWFANGFANGVLFWCIAGLNDFEGDGITPNFVDANLFISCFNNWSAVAIPAYDNDLSGTHRDGTLYVTASGGGIGYGGPGRHRPNYSYGIYTATFTGTVYLGIELRNSWGAFFQSDFLVDEVSFKLIAE